MATILSPPSETESVERPISLEEITLFNICLGKQVVAEGKEPPLTFQLGEEVFVQLYSQKSTGRGHIIGLPAEEVRLKADCRYTVQFVDGGTHDVRVQRILPVAKGTGIIITAETEDFRHMCRTQVLPGDVVLELGCSYGMATKVLCEQAGDDHVLGVDLGLDALAACAKVCGARFEHVDVVSCTEEETAERISALRAMLPTCKEGKEDSAPVSNLRQPRFLVFVDIGGNRMASALVKLIPRIAASQQRPYQIVIKSRELMTSLVAEGSLAPSLIKNAHKPMYKPPYGLTRVTTSIFCCAEPPDGD